MGRSYLVPVVVKFELASGEMTPHAWPTKYLGKPTDATLAQFLDKLAQSFLAGGVNEHVGPQKILGATVVRQRTGEILASWKYSPALPSSTYPAFVTEDEWSQIVD